jgi:hypothetical protein
MLFQPKISRQAKSRAQFTPMRTTAADSRTTFFILLDGWRTANPLFNKKQTVLVVTLESFVCLLPHFVRRTVKT